MCVLAEVLYYLSPDGVMAWDGSLPVKISGGLDNTWLMNVRGAVGGVLDTRYYLHLRVPRFRKSAGWRRTRRHRTATVHSGA